MTVLLGMYITIMLAIAHWVVLRALGRAIGRAAAWCRVQVIDALRAAHEAWRRYAIERDKRRAWRRDVQAKLQVQTDHTLVALLAEQRAELAEYRAELAKLQARIVNG